MFNMKADEFILFFFDTVVILLVIDVLITLLNYYFKIYKVSA